MWSHVWGRVTSKVYYVTHTHLAGNLVTCFGSLPGVLTQPLNPLNPKPPVQVYWGNGCQIIPPHDAGIAASIEANLELWDLPAQLPEKLVRVSLCAWHTLHLPVCFGCLHRGLHALLHRGLRAFSKWLPAQRPACIEQVWLAQRDECRRVQFAATAGCKQGVNNMFCSAGVRPHAGDCAQLLQQTEGSPAHARAWRQRGSSGSCVHAPTRGWWQVCAEGVPGVHMGLTCLYPVCLHTRSSHHMHCAKGVRGVHTHSPHTHTHALR